MQPPTELIDSLDDIGDLLDSDRHEGSTPSDGALQSMMQARYGLSAEEAEDKLKEFDDLFKF